jgi:hypothetical protein
VFLVSEIGAVAMAGVLERVRAINEKHGVGDDVFLADFGEK